MPKYQVNLSDQIQNWKLDNIFYENTPKSFLKEEEEDFKYLDINIKSLLAFYPPANSSKQTKSELLQVKSFMKQEHNDEFIANLSKMDKYPSGFVMDFYEEISNEKIDADVREVILGRDAERLAMKLKMYYDRARPFQIAEHYKLEFEHNKSVQSGTGSSPSYPSGHTLAAYFAAHVLSYLNPEFKDALLQRAELVALSRIKEGVHFPSDNQFSFYLSEKVLLPAFIKYYELSKTNLE